jgi:hypothetical protein
MTAWALFCHDFDLSKGINILSEKCPVVLDHYIPANDAQSKHINDESSVHKALMGSHISEISNPQLIWAGGSELPIDQIRGSLQFRITHNRTLAFASPNPLYAVFAHQSCYGASGSVYTLAL